jgi:DEAD/DEAH box helicase domain-containing protein
VALREFFDTNHWNIVDVLPTEPRSAHLFPVDDLALAPASREFLHQLYPGGIYQHQREALNHALAGENVCLVTGTASGKSLVFQTAAIDLLARDPKAKVMAIYPMKALGNEQRDRWQKSLEIAGLESPRVANGESVVGRIDGNVPPGFRMSILERSRVVVFTPDIIHAWMFSNLNQPAVINFLRDVRMIVVDEVHAYSGVFGSNAAFLFRRLQHLLSLLGIKPTIICASATIANPQSHLRNLLGQPFHLIGPDRDTSPRYPLDVFLVRPPGASRFMDEVVQLLQYLTEKTSSRFIAFVDSRKQVELISSILNRLLKEEAKKAEAASQEASEEEGAAPAKPVRTSRTWGKKSTKQAAEPVEDEPDPEGEVTGVLQQMNVLPYRAGYEDHDRRQIQDRLVEGTLNGVVSTSALELGIDIPHLDICVLIGVPSSATSLQQRIGRIGRHSPGSVIVVNGGDVHDEAVFAHPRSFFQRPLAESTLYLENEHIQYIHTLCLARNNGEHDLVAQASGKGRAEFASPVDWPENFIRLCLRERAGDVPRRLASLKLEARDRPNYTFPLRDVESQFKVERRDGPNVSSMGSLSFAQMMREAYPGAIYYYATIPYRVTRVNIKAKLIQVRREKRYTTQAQRTLPAVFPRLSPGGIFSAGRQDGLLTLETSLLVRESIRGVIEQRGRNESTYSYPLARELGYFQDQPYFSRNYFTTGVVLTHPALTVEGVLVEEVAAILYEAFMLLIPFERQDIGFAADRFRVDREPVLHQSEPFLTIYDQTYGSLRLTSRLLDPSTLGKVLVEAALLAGKQPALAHSPASIAALVEMARSVFQEGYEPLSFGAESEIIKRDPERWERIVMPGSKGLMVRTNEEFHVMRVVQTPAGLSYEGTPDSMVGTGASVMPLLTDVAEVPGESVVGWYEVDTGTIEPAESLESAQVRVSGETQPGGKAEMTWLRHALSVYFDDNLLGKIAGQTGVGVGLECAEMIEALLDRLPANDLLGAMLSVYLDEVKTRAEEA